MWRRGSDRNHSGATAVHAQHDNMVSARSYNTARLHVVVDPGICENWKAMEIPLIIRRSDQLGMGLMGGIKVCDNLHI